MNKALFLDLDGTLIKTKSGETFPKYNDDWKFNENILDIIKHYMAKDYSHVVIVTNQGGIESGYVIELDFKKKMDEITYSMYRHIGVYPSVYYCSTNNKDSYYRKPNPGYAYTAAIQYQLYLSKSTMVGDASGLDGQFSDSDKVFAENAGIGTYYDISEFLKL